MVCAPVRRDNPRALAKGIIDHTSVQTMFYLTCTTITSVDLAHNGVSRAKDWVSVDCGTRHCYMVNCFPVKFNTVSMSSQFEINYFQRREKINKILIN